MPPCTRARQTSTRCSTRSDAYNDLSVPVAGKEANIHHATYGESVLSLRIGHVGITGLAVYKNCKQEEASYSIG